MSTRNENAPDLTEQDKAGLNLSRRNFLRRGAAVGAALGAMYVVPQMSTVHARPAFASATPGPQLSPVCGSEFTAVGSAATIPFEWPVVAEAAFYVLFFYSRSEDCELQQEAEFSVVPSNSDAGRESHPELGAAVVHTGCRFEP